MAVPTSSRAMKIYPDLNEAVEITREVLANPTPRTIDRFKVVLVEGEQGFAPGEWVLVGGVWRCASSTKDAYCRLVFWDMLLHELYHREDLRRQPQKFENYLQNWAEIEIPTYAFTEAVQCLRQEKFPHMTRGSVRLSDRIGRREQIGQFTPPAEESGRAGLIYEYGRHFGSYTHDIRSMPREQVNLLLLGPPDFLECIGEEERGIILDNSVR